MLVSHVCRFIYLKTIKTAGTSVEIFFEPFCVDPRGYQPLDRRPAQVSAWGVVGSRGFADPVWFNHMPAQTVRAQLPADMWDRYLKFCVVRNPFDKLVSRFWHELTPDEQREFRTADFATVRACFLEWVTRRTYPVDRNIYMIDGAPAVDRFVLFERLHDDLAGICQVLGLPWQANRLPRAKGGFRTRGEHFSSYYDPAAEALVREDFAWELDRFGYVNGTDRPRGG